MDKQLKDILKEQMQMKGLSLDRLTSQTGIAERHIVALLDNNGDKLPAAPYARGYLMKIASVLDLDGPELWRLYKNEITIKQSGPTDKMPENRYALKTINKKWVIAGVIIALFLIYAISNINRFIGKPAIEITNPSSETTITPLNTILLSGRINPKDKLLIDGVEATPEADGSFSKEYSLEPGLNRIEFSVTRLLGGETAVTRQIIYQPE